MPTLKRSSKAASSTVPGVGTAWGPVQEATDVASKWLLVLILVATVWIYAPTFHYPFVEWDDPGYVSENEELGPFGAEQVRTQFSSYVVGNYHPITLLSHSVEILFFGKDPQIMHRTNVLLYLLAVVLGFLFVQRLSGQARFAVLVTMLYALHPMRVEGVAWISARKDLLMIVFMLLALLCWMAWLRSGKRRWYATAMVAFGMALLSKGMAVSLVPVLFLIDIYWRRPWMSWPVWREKLPFIVLALVSGISTIMAQGDAGAFQHNPVDPLSRYVVAMAGPLIYLAQQVVPLGLSAYYPFPPPLGGGMPFYYPLLALATMVAGVLFWRLKPPPLVVFALLFFLVNIVLVLQFIPVGHAARADRYTSFSGIGWAILMVMLLQHVIGRYTRNGGGVLLAVVMIHASVLGVLSRDRVQIWSDSVTLWTDMLGEGEAYAGMYMSRGLTLERMGRLEEALKDLDRSVELRPADQVIPVYHRAMLRMQLGKFEGGIQDFTTILAKGENFPGLVPNMVYAKMKLERCQEVIQDVDQYLDKVEGTSELLNMRAWCHFRIGNHRQGSADVQRSMAMDSSYASIRYLAGLARLAVGDTVTACEQLQASKAWPLHDERWRKDRDKLMERHCGTHTAEGEVEE